MVIRRRICFFIVFTLFLGVALSAHADLYLTNGKYRFSVTVRNRYFKDISNARGNVQVIGTTARFDIEAPGYRRSNTTTFLNPNQTNYRVDVRLEDPMAAAYVVTPSNAVVEGSLTDTFSQNMYWGDEFGIRGSFPKKGFEKLTERLVEVRINSLHAFAPRVYLQDSTDRWYFEAVIRRADMNTFSNTISIIVRRDETLPVLSSSQLADLTRDYQKNLAALASSDVEGIEVLKTRLTSVARQIRESYPGLDELQKSALLDTFGGESPLGRELRTIETFNLLHR